VEAALDSDDNEVALRSSGMGWSQAHGGAGVEVALRSSSVEAVHHVEAVLDNNDGEVASQRARI
jgi:hypothetical protein